MFDPHKIEGQLTVAAERDDQVWASHLKTAATLGTRTAARSNRPLEHPANSHVLLATGIISALGGLPSSIYAKLVDRARIHKSDRPRLVIRTGSGFIAGIRGYGPLKISEGLSVVLAKRLDAFDVIWEPIPDPDSDKHCHSLIGFARAILLESNADGIRLANGSRYLPDAVSVMQPERMQVSTQAKMEVAQIV